MGLARAFLFSGARSVVVSLWSVDDRSTAALMADFYRGFVEGGVPVSQAFQMAKKRLRSTLEFAHPVFWSPFILVGRGASLQ